MVNLILKNKSLRTVAITLFGVPVLNLPFNLLAQRNNLKFDRISIEQGLSQLTVNWICQDKKGFLWFGTYNGLNRYDGNKFTVFQSVPEDPKTLSSNVIFSIYEDHTGTLWIGTSDGLNRFDRDKEQFIRYQHDPDNPHSLSHNSINCIFEDRSGALWIGTSRGLNRFDREHEQFLRFQDDAKAPYCLPHDKEIHSICEDRSGNLWIGTDNGLFCFDRERRKTCVYRNNPKEPHSLSHNNIDFIYEDHLKVLWVGTDYGLNKWDRKQQQFTRYFHDPNNLTSLSHNHIKCIYEDHSGTLWIGTWGGGLNRFEREQERFIRYQNDPDNTNSLSNDIVISMYEDRSNVLWIGTRAGLNKVYRAKQNFILYQTDPGNPKSLSQNEVRAVYQDHLGDIWIGTYDGLNRWDRAKNEFIHYKFVLDNPHSLSNTMVYSIYEDRNGKLWIGTNGGLNQFDRTTEQFIRFYSNPDDSTSLSNNGIISMCEDHLGILWVGTWNGLNRFDRDKNQFTWYQAVPDNPHSLTNNIIWVIYEDKFGRLWLGTDGGGLNRFDREKQKFIHYKNDPNDPTSLSDNRVISIYEDQSGILWIGTARGLNQFDREKETFISYKTKDGLINDVIYCIQEDQHGNLWLSTGAGLSRFNPRTREFKNYSDQEGLQGKEFSTGACFKCNNGELLFGGVNGLNIFHPDSIKEDTLAPPIMITDFQIFNQSVPIGEPINGRLILEKSITETTALELSYKDNVFSIEFAVLHYVDPGKNQYAYKMEGLERDWNYVKTRNFVTYTNLPPGDYIFKVKGCNSYGVWNEQGTSLKITITPPFWQTWWFQTSGVIGVLLLILASYRIRTHAIRERNKQLEKRVEERTLKLRAANQEAQRRAAQAALIYKVGQRVSAKLELKALLSEIVNAIREAFDYYSVALLLHDEKANRLTMQAIASDHSDFFPKNFSLAIGEGMIGYAAASGETQVSGDVSKDPHFLRVTVEETKSELAIPIKSGEKIIGVLDIQSDQFDAFHETDVVAMETLSTQIATAIENARLYETAQRELAERVKAEKKLQKSNEELQQFAYIASHDLQEPLRKVQAFGDRLQAKYREVLGETGRDYLERMQNATQRMQNLINNLLMYSRVTTKAQPFVPVDLAQVVQEVLSDLETRLEQTGGRVEVGALPTIEADPIQMRQLMQNLISNALKFHRQEEAPVVKVYEQVLPNHTSTNGFCHLLVEDNGIGFEEKYAERIFGLFQRLHGRDQYEGTGMGLAICRKIVERHGGNITARSTPGQGSTFIVTLPVKQVH